MIRLLQFFIVSLFLRSNIYFGVEAISLMNIINVLVLVYIALSYKKKFSQDFKFIAFAILIFFTIELLYAILCYRNGEQLKEFYYSSYLFSIFALIYWSVKYEYQRFVKTSFNTVFWLYLVMFVVVIFELITNQHLPASKAAYDKGFEMVPTAFFYNPNDFAVVVVLFLPVLFYFSRLLKQEKKFTLLMFLSAFFVLASMSRLSLIFLVLFTFFMLYLQGKKKQLTVLIGSLVVVVIILATVDLSAFSKNNDLIGGNLSKLASIADVSASGNSNSVMNNIRYQVYSPIINNPQDYMIGRGFLASEDLYANKTIPLLNPHSLWAEGIFDFGLIGFAPILFILVLVLVLSLMNVRRDELFKCAIVQVLAFVFLLCIPSSVMCIPVVWVPIAIVTALITNFNNGNKLSTYSSEEN